MSIIIASHSQILKISTIFPISASPAAGMCLWIAWSPPPDLHREVKNRPCHCLVLCRPVPNCLSKCLCRRFFLLSKESFFVSASTGGTTQQSESESSQVFASEGCNQSSVRVKNAFSHCFPLFWVVGITTRFTLWVDVCGNRNLFACFGCIPLGFRFGGIRGQKFCG